MEEFNSQERNNSFYRKVSKVNYYAGKLIAGITVIGAGMNMAEAAADVVLSDPVIPDLLGAAEITAIGAISLTALKLLDQIATWHEDRDWLK